MAINDAQLFHAKQAKMMLCVEFLADLFLLIINSPNARERGKITCNYANEPSS